jgi:hypothetical protein
VCQQSATRGATVLPKHMNISPVQLAENPTIAQTLNPET